MFSHQYDSMDETSQQNEVSLSTDKTTSSHTEVQRIKLHIYTVYISSVITKLLIKEITVKMLAIVTRGTCKLSYWTNLFVNQVCTWFLEIVSSVCIWGEPERAPHKREVRAVCLSVYLSVYLSFCPYVHDTKIYKSSTNLRVPSVVDCSVYNGFGALLCIPTFNKHVVTNNMNQQVLILRSKFIGH